MQTLGGDNITGNCTDFEAVPGHGLKCSVSGIEKYTKPVEWTYTSTLTRYPCVNTSQTFVPQNKNTGASPPRNYQVSYYYMQITIQGCGFTSLLSQQGLCEC